MVAVRAEKVLAVGSYSSAVLKTVKLLLEEPLPPPVMRTLPLGSRVARWEERGDVIVAVRAVKVLAAASYSSAVLRSEELLLKPPVRSTWPFGSRVAVCSSRAVVIVAVRAVNVFVV